MHSVLRSIPCVSKRCHDAHDIIVVVGIKLMVKYFQ